jgi:ribonucleoside-diphosphate reductase alpha chain
MYERDKVWKNTLGFFNGNEMLANIWMDKYCLRDLSGNFLELTPDDMFVRLAREFHRIESKYKNAVPYEQILSLLKEQVILPGGSILYGVGNNFSISSLGNCFVIGNSADSYGGILATDQEQVQLMKRRAGVGHDLSHLRPNKSPVTNAAGTSTGPVSYMNRFSNSTREVAQDGRRGALMLTLNCNHGDIEDFIDSKIDTTKITGANISVKITDHFMKSLDYYESANKPIWDKLINRAWRSAEPGVLFWDTVIKESPADCYEGYKSTSTNPCGEIPLCPYDSCRLLSVNLYSFVDNPFTKDAKFNWERFKSSVIIAQRLMDDIVDLEEEKIDLILKKIDNDPEPEEIKAIERNLWIKIKEKLLQGRRTGLSGIGLADLLAGLGIPYSSKRGIDLAEEVYKQLAISAYSSSVDMAKERGAFPIWDFNKEIGNPFINRIFKEFINDFKKTGIYPNTDYLNNGRRNIALLTIPPSGTISLLADISSGIEPVYMLFHKRKRKVNPDNKNISFIDKNGDCWEEYVVLHPKFKEWWVNYRKAYVKNKDWEKTNGLVEYDLENMSKENLTLVSQLSPYVESTAYELDPIERVKLQGRIQKWIDHSISSTINLPTTVTEPEVSDLYLEAWKSGCKGLTIYRDGCRDGVLTAIGEAKVKERVENHSLKRPKEIPCEIFTVKSGGVYYNVIVGIYLGSPYEIFATTNIITKSPYSKGKIVKVKRGHYRLDGEVQRDLLMEKMSDHEKTITRLISGQLRHNRPIKYVVEDLLKLPGEGMHSFNRVLARILKKYIEENEVATGISCENCGSNNLVYVGGCLECRDCGNSKCG